MSREDSEEQKLDAVLHDWAARHALPVSQAETIRRAIVLTPASAGPELSVAWWHQLFGALSLASGQVTDISRYLRFMPTV